MVEKIKNIILIAGYYGFENTGDEAILSAMLVDFRKQRSNLEIIVVSSNPTETAALYHVQSVHWKDIKGLLNAARESDLIIVGGGGIFQDYWGVPEGTHLTQYHWGISYYSSIGLLANLFKKPFMIYSVGIGPLLTEEGKRWTRLTFELADAATVRDSESKALLASLGIPAKQIHIKPDPGLSLAPKAKAAPDIFEAAGVSLRERPLLGICLRNWIEGEKSTAWKQELASALDRFLEKNNVQMVFIPFQVVGHELENDHAVALELIALTNFKDRVHAISETYSPEVTAGLISRCRMLIGMRLHSLIFAASAGVPALALAYDPKVHNFMKSLGLSEYALDLQTMDTDQLTATLNAVWKQRKQIRAILTERSGEISKLAHQNTALALKLLDGKIKHIEKPVASESLRNLVIKQTTNLVERDAHIDALMKQVATATKQVASLTKQVAARTEQVAALTEQVATGTKQVASLTEQVAALTEQVAALTEQVAARMEQVASLTEQAAVDKHEIDYLRWQVAYEQQKQNEILSSRVWKLAFTFRRIRMYLLPPESRLERLVKWMYQRSREIITRLREAIRRHGLVKAILRGFAILGIRLSHPIKKFLFKSRYERELRELERAIANHKGFFDIFHVPMGWNTMLFQRFQHVSLQAAKMGGLALYGGHPTVDHNVFVYRQVKKNLFVFKATDTQVVNRVLAALEKRKDETVILRIQSIDLVTTADGVQDFFRRGFKVVYEYIDLISPDITGNVPDLVHRRHEAFLKDERVIVVATSDQIYEDVQRHRSQNFVLSTNGVDVNHWRISKRKPPEDLKPALTGRTIVGYHGALAKWTDYNLLRMIADEGSYELVLIGHEHDDEFPKSGLKEHPRVHFLGSKSYFDLNSYAIYYDVAILPFKKSNLTEAVSPVKIFEYMAALKPIVTTDLRECRKYKSCLIAETNEEFMSQLKRAAELKDDTDYLNILDLEAKENSWQAKTAEILKLAGVNL